MKVKILTIVLSFFVLALYILGFILLYNGSYLLSGLVFSCFFVFRHFLIIFLQNLDTARLIINE